MARKFPHYARFDDCIVKASIDKSVDMYLSKASLEDLKTLDINSVVDLGRNVDLVGTIFNAAVINRINRNGEGIDAATAIKIKDLFIHKPHNLEHKSNRIIGHVVKAGWSSFGDNKMLSDDDVKDLKEPFNLVLGSVVYSLVDEKFTDLLLEASDPSSDKFMTIATSWEVGFVDWYVAIGSKNLNEAELIKDKEKIKELKPFLKCYGGSGTLPDGRCIGRVITGEVGDVLPVGMAYTTKPAAEVSGVVTQNWTDLLTEEEKMELATHSEASIQNNQENSSQTIELDVKNISQAKITYMKFKDIKELLAAASSKEGLSEASVAEFIADKIEAASKEFEAKQTAKASEVKQTAEKATALEQELSKANTKLAELSATLEQFEKSMAAKQKSEDFQTRMHAIASEYELSPKENEVVAKQIKDLDEKSYASWFESFSVFAETKSKKSIAAAKEAADVKIAEEAKKLSEKEKSTASTTTSTAAVTAEVSKASEETSKEKVTAEVVKAAIENTTEAANQSIANTTVTKGVDTAAAWKEAFGGKDVLKITL